MKKCPGKDFDGNILYEGDKLKNASGQSGELIFYPDRTNRFDQWVVNYGCYESRIHLQVSNNAQAVKTT